ncbi:MAG: hypothetical protein RI953_1947 [Pseudomonadota bacterium]|jgi:hypothetical protein
MHEHVQWGFESMNGIWSKGQQAWRLPDSAEKADDKAPATASNSNKEADNPTFEIDFSLESGSFVAENSVDSASAHNMAPSADQAAENISSLEVGSPGNFESVQHDHGFRLSVEAAPAPSQLLEDIPAQPAIVMVDEPLPESLSGGAAMQDLFVAEVLKGAQGFAPMDSPATADEHQSTMISSTLGVSNAAGVPTDSGSEKTIANGGTSLGVEDKTQITLETLREKQNTTGLSADDKTIASHQPSTAVPFVPEPPPALQPPPALAQTTFSLDVGATAAKPADADKTKTKSGASTSKDSSTKNDKSEKTKAGAASKDKPTATKKTGTGQGQKSKDGAANVKPVGGDKTNSAALTNANNVAIPGAVKGLSKEARILLALFVPAIVVFAFALFKKSNSESMSQQMATEIAAPPKEQQSTPAAKPTATAAKTKDKNKLSASAKSSDNKANASDKKNEGQESNDEDDSENSGSEENDDIELDHILTRPVSRYSEGNKPLVPLMEIALALDRVQPRRVLTLMRVLPAGFATTDPLQKVALRELTARYYMQVGAYQKALILFRQVCSDPAKLSDIEVCLHAARAAVVVGFNDDAKEIATGLQKRLVGQDNQWREWNRLIENSIGLSNPTVEAFVRFADDLADKGPFLTTEWNIQLATLFARSFLLAPESVRIEVLKSIGGPRKKNIEVRLAPDKYGQDVGSYMMPAFLNLMLRHYEIPQLNIMGEEPDTDSELSMVSWVFNVIAQAKSNEPRETRARLAPLFAERGFSALARLIEGQLAAQAGDYVGAHAMIMEQIGPTLAQDNQTAASKSSILQTRLFINATQRLKTMPFLFVEWLFLGVKVSAGLNDKESLKTYLVALEDARRRFPELSKEIQYWFMVSRANRVLGFTDGVEKAVGEAAKLVATVNDSGFVAADRVWLLMKRGQKKEAKAMMRRLLVEIPHHARLLELAAEFSAPWGEEPSAYLRLEAEIPQKFQTRGRDSVLVSFFTLRKLLSNF